MIGRALAQPVTYLGVAMLVFIFCALAYLLEADRKGAYEDGVLRANNLEQSFSHVFTNIDSTLLYLRQSYDQSSGKLDLDASSRHPSVSNEPTFEFAIVDTDGRIVSSSFSRNIVGETLGNEEYFRTLSTSSGEVRDADVRKFLAPNHHRG